MAACEARTRRRCHSKISFLLALAAGMLFLPCAQANHLIGVGTQPSPAASVTEAEQPNLKGTTVEDKMEPFDVTNTYEGRDFRLKGRVLVRVVQDDDGTLAFYYRIYLDTETNVYPYGLKLDFNGSHGTINLWEFLDLAFRGDKLGAGAPVSVLRDSQQTLTFGFVPYAVQYDETPLKPGGTSKLLMVRLPQRIVPFPGAKSYAPGGHLTIEYSLLGNKHTGRPVRTSSLTVPMFIPVGLPSDLRPLG